MKLSLKTYEEAYAGAPMKKKAEEHNTSALYGLDTNLTQNHLISKGAYSSDAEFSAMTLATDLADNDQRRSLYQVLERLRRRNQPDYIREILNNAHKKTTIRDVFKFDDIDRKV